jgi:hypothetical protein
VKIDEGTDWRNLTYFLKKIKKRYPKFKLLITGNSNSDTAKKIIKKFNLTKLSNVKFIGFINKKKLNDIYDQCLFGITSYKKTKRHNYWNFGDSIKIREYADSGLIVISEGLYQNTKEIIKYKFGKVYKTSNDLFKVINFYLKNNQEVNSSILRSKNWADKFNKKTYDFFEKI